MPFQLIVFLGAMAAAAALVPVCRRIARRLGYVAKPRPDRWHQQPTALLGGIAIALPVIAGMALLGGLHQLPVLMFCATAIALVGLTDDVMSLKPATKLVAQIALASVLLAAGHRLHWVQSMSLDSVLTILWVVGITNAFNLLDNMDGLCGGLALIAGTAFLFSHAVDGSEATRAFNAQYLTLLLGAVAGFLVYNLHPASIFMGDAGSLFLGFSLAALTLGSETDRAARSGLLTVIGVPMMVLLIPILDTTLVTLSRLLSGRPASRGGRDHSSHRLVAIGLSERRAVSVLWTLAAAAGAAGFVLRSFDPSWSVLLVSTLLLAMTVFTVYLGNVRVYEGDVQPLVRGTATPIVINFMYKRRVAEVLLDFCLVTVAYYAAYRLRFEGEQFEPSFPRFFGSLPIVIACQMTALFVFGAYRGVWKYFTLIDGVVLGKGILVGTITAQLAILFLHPDLTYSRSVFVIYAALLFLLVTGSRASFRLISEFASRRRRIGERVVVYGAGAAGGIGVREIMSNPSSSYRIIGFVDDDLRKQRRQVSGYPVLGSLSALERMMSRGEVDVVLISSKAIDPGRLAALQNLATTYGIRLLKLDISIGEMTAPGARPIRFSSGVKQ
jgi:UDP-GlcNAc:undecaprenyl-phosphate GlcNAc-1-phosphate transferase